MRRILFVFLSLSSLGVAQVKLEFTQAGSNTTFSRVLPLPNGNQLLVGTTRVFSMTGLYNPPIQHSVIALVSAWDEYPPCCSAVPALGGSGNDVPQAVAVDPSGNIWIAGNTDSDDFNLVNPIVVQKVPYRTAGFVVELDPTGSKLLFSTYLAGKQSSTLPNSAPYPTYATYATAITIDGSGNVYVGGSTDEADFPTTPGAFLSGKGGADVFGNTYFYPFLVKISPAGKLVYSTQLGTGASDCVGGSACVANESTSATVTGLAVNLSGAVTVAGILGGAYNPGGGYVSRVAADGSAVLSTTIALSAAGVRSLFMAQDSSGNIDLFGQFAPVSYRPGPQGYTLGTPELIAEQLSSDGSSVVYSTNLGESADASAAGIILDSSGNAWLAGTSSSAQFPALDGVPNLGADFVLRLDPAGAKAQTLFRFPRGVITGPPAMDSSGNLLLPGSHGSLLIMPPTYAFDSPAIVAFANSASLELNTGLFGGALTTLYGFDLTDSTQGLQVSIDGNPAPVLFAGPNQINVQVPFEVAYSVGTVPEVPQVQVMSPSGSVLVALPRVQSIGIFTTDGVHAAALNQDGSVNSPSNPAARGSIVSLFGTGVEWPAGMQDGATAPTAMPLDQEANKLQMFDSGGTPLSILYAGSAPGLIDGVFQINVQLPPDAVPPLTLQTAPFGNTFSSNAVQVYLQ